MHRTKSMYVVFDKFEQRVVGIYSLIEAKNYCSQLNQKSFSENIRYQVQGPFIVNLDEFVFKKPDLIPQPKPFFADPKLVTIEENNIFDFKNIK